MTGALKPPPVENQQVGLVASTMTDSRVDLAASGCAIAMKLRPEAAAAN